MIIDSHQHFWKPERGDYGWMDPADPILFRDFLPEDLAPILKRLSVAKTIVVQAAPTMDETDFLLQLAAENNFIAGVVGWLDLESAKFAVELARYRKNPKFLGLRPMLQDLTDDFWILRPSVMRNLEVLAEASLPLDLLIHTRHLPNVLRVLERVSGLCAVIDHLSKPEIKARTREPWATLMKEVAAHPNTYCKLSGMVTEADHKHWQIADLQPYVDHVIDIFGWNRIMFGSDWPVCLLAGSYDQVHEALKTMLVPKLTVECESRVFSLNAREFYQLDREDPIGKNSF